MTTRTINLCLLLACAVVANVKAFIPSIRIQTQNQRLHSSTLETEETTSTMDVSALPLPPNNGMNLYRNIRDTFSYLASPQRFISKRYKELGPTFVAYQFFKPIVFVGNMTLVNEYIKNAERKNQVIYPSLPDTFLELHSKWGALNLDSNDEIFKQARLLFTDVLSNKEALSMYTKVLEEKIEAYVTSIETRVRENPEEPIYLVPELISLNLDMFATIFSGRGLTKEEEQQFVDYNAGLLSLSKNSKQWVQAKEAFDDLKVEMLKRFRELDDVSEDDLTVPGKFYHGKVDGREGFEDEDRVATATVLFIWGAYIECASLMATSLARISATKEPSLTTVQNLCNEMNEQFKVEGSDVTDYSFWSDLSYSMGVIRESLRLIPPVSGLPKFSKSDYQLGDYRIPAEVPVCLEPRIVNQDPSVHIEPASFEPMRWVPEKKDMSAIQTSTSSCPFQGVALKRPEAWFPGGNGAHKCPGLGLAEHVTKIFVSKMSTRFASWEYNGDGLKKDGDIKVIEIPVTIPPNDFGMKFKLRE